MLRWWRRVRPEQAQALALDRQGRLREAIAAWTDLNLREPDAATEKRILALRHDAARTPPSAKPVDRWPPEFADPYPEVSGRPPECSARELTTPLVGGAVHHHGCLLVRGLLTAESAAELVATVDAALAARDAATSRKPRADETRYYAHDPAYDATGTQAFVERAWCEQLGGLLVADSPRGLFQLLASLRAAGVPRLIEEYFNEPPEIAVEKCVFRRVEGSRAPAWHQDGSFLGEGVRALNVWIALTRCGGQTDCPGLEIVPRRVNHLVARGGDNAISEIEVSPELARAGLGAAPVAPLFEAGDALIFDELFLHQTMPGGTRTRYAAEVWVFAPSHLPPRYVTLAF